MGAVAGRAEHTFPVSSQSLLLSLQGPLPVSVSLRHGSNVSLHPQSPGASLLSETGQSLRNKAASQQCPEDTDGISLQADSGEGAAGSGHPPHRLCWLGSWLIPQASAPPAQPCPLAESKQLPVARRTEHWKPSRRTRLPDSPQGGYPACG